MPTPTQTLFFILTILNIADAILTAKILDRGGQELNPIMRVLMTRLSVIPALVIAKLAMLVVVFFAVFWPLHAWPYTPHLLGVLCLFYAGIVAHNWRQVRKV